MKGTLQQRVERLEKRVEGLEKMLDMLTMSSDNENVDWKEHLAKAGKKGGESRANKLSAERRKEIAQKAARTLWERRRKERESE